jgi:ribosomal protein L19
MSKQLKKKKYFFRKGDFIQVEKKVSRNSKRTKKIFGRCINYKKNGINSTITILYVAKKYKIIETIPVYSPFVKNITLYKKLK